MDVVKSVLVQNLMNMVSNIGKTFKYFIFLLLILLF